jgi:hypothetical protein
MMMPTSPITFITNALRAAATADQGPADDQDDEVVGEHQQQHREDEEVHLREEARVVVVCLILHIANRVEVDQAADPGDDQRHGCGEGVEVEVDVDRRHGEPQLVGA